MNWFGFILAQCLNALSQASILFFIACRLTLIFGIMRIVNFAHGVVFMLGAYVGYTANVVTGSFLVSLVVAPIVVGLVGMAFERIFLRHLYGRRDGGAYLLLTFGLAVVLSELIRLICDRKIDPGKVFDLELPLAEAAEGYRAMDERRAIKVLLTL